MEELLAMGFGRDQILRALSNTVAGDMGAAIEYMLSESTLSTQTTTDDSYSERRNLEIPPPISGSADEVIVTLDISQYTFSETGGSSACTAIAGCAIKYLIEQLSCGNFHSVTDRSCLEAAILSGVMEYNVLQFSDPSSHTSIDQILPSILMDGKLRHVSEGLDGGIIQGMLTDLNCFRNLFDTARSHAEAGNGIMLTQRTSCIIIIIILLIAIINHVMAGKYIGLIITKPPETVCLLLPPIETIETTPAGTNTTASSSRYVFFDSHSRPQLGFYGSYLVASSRQEDIVRRLQSIFIPLPVDDVDEVGMDELGWNYIYNMQMMYNMFEASVLQLR